jgi:hypothetical protein
MEPEPDFLMQLALTALKASHRDAAWLASAALDNAMHRALEDGYSEAMELANKAIRVRDAIAERIAMIEPKIAKAVAVSMLAEHGADATPLH